jgi:two-component system, NarL family, sensor histidine kinase DesK
MNVMNDTNIPYFLSNTLAEDSLDTETTERQRRPRGGWLVGPPLALIFLIYPIQAVLASNRPVVLVLFAVGGTALFAAGFLWLMWMHEPFPLAPSDSFEIRKRRAVIALLALLTITLNLVFGFEWRGLLFHTNVVAGLMLIRRDAYAAIVGLAVATLGLGITAGEAWFVLPTAALGLWATAFASQIATVAELHAAREELARRAVVEERLRFARDLHDLLGHSLSLITLKSELAGRLLPSAPERAAKEIREAEQVARRALREVREAVSGYRQSTLDEELFTAEEILKAAGIACRIENSADLLPKSVESMVAWVVREGTTNVVRHSRARHCTIQLVRGDGTVNVQICDDGRGIVPAQAGIARATGSGLSGLAERIASFAGAALDAGSLPEGGFRLRVSLPLTEGDAREEGRL